MTQLDQRDLSVAPQDPWTTPERLALRDLALSFTRREIAPHLPEWEDAGELPRSLHRSAAQVGLLGIGFPEEVGGSGGDLRDLVLLTEAVMEGGGSSGVLAGLLTHNIALPHLVASGDPDQIRRYAVPTLAGEMIGSLGITEPDTGSDVAGIRTTARREGECGEKAAKAAQMNKLRSHQGGPSSGCGSAGEEEGSSVLLTHALGVVLRPASLYFRRIVETCIHRKGG